jgi:GWxTD domain-containing protein
MFGLILAGALVALPQDPVDKLPEHHRKWLAEEVPYLISEVEREVFLGLESEEEREAFVAAFWRKRDENPATLENEYRDEHYKRLAYVNEFFGRDSPGPGWRTDRGRYYILLGPPRNRQNFDGSDAVYPSELWFYDNPELKRYGLPPFFSLLFFRRHGAGELEIYSPVLDGPQALLTGTDTRSNDFRQDIERAYDKLYEVDPELAQASLSFRTDEGDTAQFSGVSFGTMALMDQIVKIPFHGLDTSYAERLDFERGAVESDYLFKYVSSVGAVDVLEGDDGVSFVHWVIEIPPENIAFVLDGATGVYGSAFIVSVEAALRDDPDVVVIQSRNESFVQLKESERASLHRPFAYSGMTPLVPGAYNFRVILRNRACPSRVEKECIKSYTLLDQEVDVPAESGRALRGLLVGYGSDVRSGAPLYRAYRLGTVEILPNPSGVFAIGETMTVAVAHRAPETASVRLVVESQDPGGGTMIDQSVELKDRIASPLIQELSFEKFQGGRFLLRCELIDGNGSVRERASAPFTVSPRTAIPRPLLRGAAPQVRPEIPGLVSSMLGEQYLARNETAKARERFERAVEENPKLGLAREHLARLLIADSDYEKVVALLEPVYAEVKDRYEVLAPLGEAYFRRGDFARAAEILEKALPLRRPRPELLNALASSQYQLQNSARALELFEQSLSLDPDQPEVRNVVEKLKAERASSKPGY